MKGKDIHKIRLMAFQNIALDCARFLDCISCYTVVYFPLRNYLCDMTESKARRALYIVISSVSKRIM
jgi:hypothetical protein